MNAPIDMLRQCFSPQLDLDANNDNLPQVGFEEGFEVRRSRACTLRAEEAGSRVCSVFTPQAVVHPGVVGVLRELLRLAKWFLAAFLTAIPSFCAES